jgi:single-strand DNA-binding protein
MLNASIIGNLGSDPELKYSPAGQPFVTFNVAANQRVKEQGGEWADRTEWVRCIVFGNRAESLAQNLKKGSKVYVDGRLEARPWTSQSGDIRAGLQIAAASVEFMSPRSEDAPARPLGAAIPSKDQDDDSLPF